MTIDQEIEKAVADVLKEKRPWHIATFNSKEPEDINRWVWFATSQDCATSVGFRTARLYLKCASVLQRDGTPFELWAIPPAWRWFVFNRAAWPRILQRTKAVHGIPKDRALYIESH